MVGIIVTGHGSFATGITSGLCLLAGKPEDYVAVDFIPEDSIDTLTGKIQAAVKELENCGEIMVYADLAGGSPFNVSIRMQMERPETMEVIGGANLPVVLDGYMSRMMGSDVHTLAENGLKAGREAMVRFVPAESEDDDEFEE